jgi:signal transduction histidine kinase
VNSLRLRLVLLCALVAMICTALCALAASRSLDEGARAQARRQGEEALAIFDRQLSDVLATLTAEAILREHADSPQAPVAGELAQVIEVERPDHRVRLAAAGEIVSALETGAPAFADEIRRLASGAGVASVSGQPLLFAYVGTGASRALALCPFSSVVAERLSVPGWTLSVGASTSEGDPARGVAVRRLPVLGGTLWFVLTSERSASRDEWARAQAAIVAAGLATAAAATLAGALLAWLWMRPLALLVDACRARARDAALPLPRIAAPEEAVVLRDALQALLDAERGARDSLAQNLEREAAVNAVHQRFLAQLAHEFAQPIRALAGTIELMRSQGGRLDPERLDEARATALKLEERFQEVLGLAADHLDRQGPQPRLVCARYLADLVAILRPQSETLGVALAVEAGEDALAVDARLLSPILVNLASNALRAAAPAGRDAGGARVTLSAHVADGLSRWRVEDTGHGIAEPLAGRIVQACARGEVLPAEPGIGLGLALSLANARALGGTLRLVRNDGTGACFELTLPSRDG